MVPLTEIGSLDEKKRNSFSDMLVRNVQWAFGDIGLEIINIPMEADRVTGSACRERVIQ